MTSSGTRDGWRPAALPDDPMAAGLLTDWLANPVEPLNLTFADLRGADLAGGPLAEAWLTGADLRRVRLRGADLTGVHLEAARLEGTDLTGCRLVKSDLSRADLRDAVFDLADFGSAEILGADARQGRFRGCYFANTAVIDVDARGADFSGATIERSGFRIHLDDTTAVRGLRGDLSGPCMWHDDITRHELDGAELQQWLRDRGADVRVAPPAVEPRRFGWPAQLPRRPTLDTDNPKD